MPQLELYSANVCPYVHRTRLVLKEKGLDATLIEVDPRNKPDWFLKISPYGKIPLLKHGEHRIYESAIINEYLEEVFPQPRLMPGDAVMRAQARIWIDFCNIRFAPALYALLTVEEPEAREEHAQTMAERLQALEEQALGHSTGPYWFGKEISLTDLAFYPFFERFVVLEHFRNMTIPKSHSRIHRWLAAMRERDSVKELANAPEYYIEHYRNFLKSNDKPKAAACPIAQ